MCLVSELRCGTRPEPPEERRKRLSRLLSRKTKAMRDGIQLSEAITGDGAAIFRRRVRHGPRRDRLEADRLALRERQDAGQVKEGLYVSLSQSQPEDLSPDSASVQVDDCTCSSGRRQSIPLSLVAPPCSLGNVSQFVVDIRLIHPLGSFRKAISSQHGFDHQRIMTTSGQFSRPLSHRRSSLVVRTHGHWTGFAARHRN